MRNEMTRLNCAHWRHEVPPQKDRHRERCDPSPLQSLADLTAAIVRLDEIRGAFALDAGYSANDCFTETA
jgi:hypothetical protein